MILYLHRANEQAQIKKAIRFGWGIEIDVRSCLGNLYLAHDPILRPHDHLDLEVVLDQVRKHKIPTILDIKETGIVHWLDGHGLSDLVYATDLIYPDQRRVSGAIRTLSRHSPFESITRGEGFWLDYVFEPVEKEKEAPINDPSITVLVSPELHGQSLTDEYVAWVKEAGFMGVCTDFPERYQ